MCRSQVRNRLKTKAGKSGLCVCLCQYRYVFASECDCVCMQLTQPPTGTWDMGAIDMSAESWKICKPNFTDPQVSIPHTSTHDHAPTHKCIIIHTRAHAHARAHILSFMNICENTDFPTPLYLTFQHFLLLLSQHFYFDPKKGLLVGVRVSDPLKFRFLIAS